MFHLDPAGRAFVHQLKYHGERRLLHDLGRMFRRAPGFLEFVSGALLIPVPLHPRKLRRRGYNQSLWFAQALASEAGPDTVAYDCLRRLRHTPSQTELDREQRREIGRAHV